MYIESTTAIRPDADNDCTTTARETDKMPLDITPPELNAPDKIQPPKLADKIHPEKRMSPPNYLIRPVSFEQQQTISDDLWNLELK